MLTPTRRGRQADQYNLSLASWVVADFDINYLILTSPPDVQYSRKKVIVESKNSKMKAMTRRSLVSREGGDRKWWFIWLGFHWASLPRTFCQRHPGKEICGAQRQQNFWDFAEVEKLCLWCLLSKTLNSFYFLIIILYHIIYYMISYSLISD